MIELNQKEADRLSSLRQSSNSRKFTTIDKLHELHSIHTEHPEYTRRDLAMVTGIGKAFISKYWRTFVNGQINVIRPWDEVMS